MEALYSEAKPKDNGSAIQTVVEPPLPPPNVKPCRYGLGCNRPDCKFWHPEVNSGQPEKVDIGDKLDKLNLSWVPMSMRLARNKDGKIVSASDDLTGDEDGVEEVKSYQL